MRRPATPVALAALALAILACETTVNPATGRREVLLMGGEEERQAEAQAQQQIQQQFGTAHDEVLAEYVRSVGEALAAHSPRQDVTYRFWVVEMDDPNAFALPAGGIYVSRGLLLLMNSEAELANVLAHEIAHVAARHAAQRHAHQATFGLATLLGNLASGSSAEDAGSQRESIGGVSGIAAYGRNQEREADRIGQDLVVAAGVDPTAMSSILRSLQSERRRLKGYVPPNSYFSTHPTDIERIAENATRAQMRRWTPRFAIAKSQADFLRRLDGIPVGRPAAEGIVEDSRFTHPELGFSLRFPAGWKVENANAYVMATSPESDAIALLTLDSEGGDPLEAARRYASREGLRMRSVTPVKIGALDAARGLAAVQTPRGPADAEITFIAWDGRIYRIATGRLLGGLRGAEGLSRAISRTFRPLGTDERAELTELRLRIVEAREGETLEDVSRRTGNEWDVHRTATVNGLVMGARLAEGQLVKVALREPYRIGQGSIR